MICQGHFIFHQKHGYSRKETEDPEARDRVRRQIEKGSEEIAKMIHPHDDEPDPLLIWGTITSLRCFLLSALDLSPCLFYLLMKLMILKDVRFQNTLKSK